MSQLQSLLNTQYYKISLLLVLGGYLTILGELIFSGHTVGSQIIGFYSTVLGALLVTHGLIDPRMNKMLAVFLLVLSIFGVVGVYKHFTVREAKTALAVIQQKTSIELGSALEPGRIVSPPFIAPLAISGLSLFAMLTVLGAKKKTEAEDA